MTDNEEVERALVMGVSQVMPGKQIRLLWDSRRSNTPLSAHDIARRIGMVESLVHRRAVVRCGLLMDGMRQPAALSLFRTELQSALPGLPVRVFDDKDKAISWLESAELRSDEP